MAKSVSETYREKRKAKSVSEMDGGEINGKSATDQSLRKSVSEMDGDERVIATAEQIVFSVDRLDTTHDMLSILSEFDSRFSLKIGRLQAHLEERFRSAQELVSKWAPPTANPRYYLQAVDEIHSLMANAYMLDDMVERAQSLSMVAKDRLVKELQHALHRHSLLPDTKWLYNRLSGPEGRGTGRNKEDSASGIVTREDYQNVGFLLDLVRPEVVPDIRAIAKRLIAGQYDQECCQAYADVRKEFLDETLRRLGLEKLSIDEIHKTACASLEGKIKNWTQALKIAVRVLFPGEKKLCNQIFQGMGLVEQVCFSETCELSMMQLLIFSEAMTISYRSSERLFRILDMYETLSDLMVDVDSVFSDELISKEASDIVVRLGEAAEDTFWDFANSIERDDSKIPNTEGAIHPLNRYVMNYCSHLFDYLETVLKLVQRKHPNNRNNPKAYHDPEVTDSSDDESINSSSLSQHLLKILETLEWKLNENSKLCKDSSLAYLFLMNNIHFIVQTVKDSSELRAHLGDDWVKEHCGQVRQLATKYQRAAWNKVLGFLKDAGLYRKGGFSGGVSKGALKERFKRFNAAFEDIYRTQKIWTVPDWQLREELRISITEKLVPAYRYFVGRYRGHLDSERHAEKYIKYTPEGLENNIMQLFEGSPGPVDHHQCSNFFL